MIQGSLYPSDPVCVSGKSREARANSVEGARKAAIGASGQAGAVLFVLRQQGPMTRHELADATGLPITTLCARLKYLKDRGFVEEAGSIPGPHGVKNTVYRATT